MANHIRDWDVKVLTQSGPIPPSRRFGKSFWVDWAPMIVLGLIVAFSSAWSVAGSVTGGYPAPVVVAQAKGHAPKAKPLLPARTLAELHSSLRIE